ncbi:MAG TPA: hypothetical protein VJB39_03330 [Patescibacteria group bacterium]|nr:hypothetical protein [Patescibacteria group bacterium]
MKHGNFVLTTIKYLFLGLVKHVVFWPLWWYTGGFLLVLKGAGRKIATAWKGLALDVWLKNIFRPMYGQYDAASRIISFLIRLIQIIVRLAAMAAVTVLILIWPVVYLLWPAGVIFYLFNYGGI